MTSADVVAYAELLARLTHRFTDREGLLDARGLSEDDVARLEAKALAVLASDSSAALPFVRELVATRRALLAEVDADAASAGEAWEPIPSGLIDATIQDVPREAALAEGVIEAAMLETIRSGGGRGSK